MPSDLDVRTKPPRPRLRLRVLLVIVLAVLLSPVAAWVAWTQIEAARLDRAVDVLEARHEPLDITEFDVKPATSEQREASHVYAEAMKLVGDTTPDLAITRKTIEALCSFPPTEGSRTEQIAALQSLEDRYKPALELLDRASRLDASGWDDADRPKRFSMEAIRPRNLGLVNAVRIARLACIGRDDPAAAALFSTLRLRRVTMSHSLSRWSVPTSHSLQSVLTFTSPNPALLQEIQQEYDAATDEDALAKHLQYSRAFWLAFTMPGVFSDPPAGFGTRRVTPLEAIATRLTRALRDHRTVAELREFDEAAAAARQPWPVKLDAVAALTAKYPSVPSGSIRPRLLVALTRPFGSHVTTASLSTVLADAAETLARTRASVGAVAVARYRQSHHGILPASLQELIPEYLSAPLIDPYTGKELKYRRGDGGQYKVYSVGFNRLDDSGVWDQQSDLQSSRRGNPPDIGIAVRALAPLRP